MIRMLMALVALFVAVPAAAEDGATVRTAIEAAMLDSAEGWNRSDLDRFLAVYSDDPATSFTTSAGVERGKADIRARYLVTYARQFGGMRAAAPTRLSFEFVDLRPIGDDHALLIARWTLVTNGHTDKAETGMTSLIFRKEAGGWKIIADHSS